MIAFARTKDEAIAKLNLIRLFLNKNLSLELNSKTQIFKSKQGVNFCGYKINEYRLNNVGLVFKINGKFRMQFLKSFSFSSPTSGLLK